MGVDMKDEKGCLWLMIVLESFALRLNKVSIFVKKMEKNLKF